MSRVQIVRLSLQTFAAFLVVAIAYYSFAIDRRYSHAGPGIELAAGIKLDNINGLLATRNPPHWFPTRKGNPFLIGFYLPQSCEPQMIDKPGPMAFNFENRLVELTGYSNDCIYRHSPGGGELLYHALFDNDVSLFHLRILPALMFGLTFFLAVAILEIYFGLLIAMMACALTFLNPVALVWAGDLLFVPFEGFFFALSLCATHLYCRRGANRFYFWLGQAALFAHLIFSFKFFAGNVMAVSYLLLRNDKKSILIFIGNVTLAGILFVLPRYIAEPEIFSVAADRIFGEYGFGRAGDLLHMYKIPQHMFGVALTCLLLVAGIGLGISDRKWRWPTLGLAVVGLSFWIIFPSTAIYHYWWNTHHLAPVFVLSLCLILRACNRWHRLISVAVFTLLMAISSKKLYDLKFGEGWIADPAIRNDLVLTVIGNRETEGFHGSYKLFDGKSDVGVEVNSDPFSVQIYLQKKMDHVLIDYYVRGQEFKSGLVDPANDCQIHAWDAARKWVTVTTRPVSGTPLPVVEVTFESPADLLQIRCVSSRSEGGYWLGEIGVRSN